MIPHSSPTIDSDDIDVVREALREKSLGSGKAALLFKKKLEAFFRAQKAVLTPSGTMAIVLAIKSLKLSQKDRIVIPAYVCSQVARAVLISGATPLVVDINRDDYNISYKDTLKKIGKNTKAIILPHIFGNPIRDIIKFLELGIPVIEDIAQSMGGELNGKKLGTFSEIAISSFYATKMITTGEGGVALFNSDNLCKNINGEKYYYKMPDFQSILGVNQLGKLNSFIKRRREIARKYVREMAGLAGISVRGFHNDGIYYRFIVEVDKGLNRVIEKMHGLGIQVERYTDLVINCLDLDINGYPNTKDAIKKVLSIPIYPSLTDEDVMYIVANMKKVSGEMG